MAWPELIAGRGRDVQLGRAIFVEAHGELGTGDGLDVGDRAERNHLARVIGDIEAAHVVRLACGNRLRPRHRPATGVRSG